MTTTLPPSPMAAALAPRLEGRVLGRADAGYDELRLAWNRSYEHRPDLIVIPASTGDVVAAVAWAAGAGMPIAIQATGHGAALTCDGGMLLLTRDLAGVAVDADTWTARIGAGAKWDQVLGPAGAAGLAPLLGSTPDVSAVGYTLGGGMGWLARKYGLAADHVRSIEIVTADGEVRVASPDSEPDLFWALRGGGAGCLGVVTAIEIDLVPVASLYAGNLLYPAGMAGEVVAHYREWIASAPESLTSANCFMNFPPLDDVPKPIRGRSFTIVRGAFVGPDDQGEELLGHWRGWRAPELDMWGRIPFAEVATISNDPLDPLPAIATTDWLDELSDQAGEVLAGAVFGAGSPLLFAEVRHCGGAIARGPEHPNAYGNRARRHVLEVVGITPTPEAFAAAERFIAGMRADLAPALAGGAYLNFLEGAEKLRRTREGFEPAAWERLRAVKASYDPANLFSHGLAVS